MSTQRTPVTVQTGRDDAPRARDGALDQASPLEAVLTAMVTRRLWFGARPVAHPARIGPHARQTSAVRRRLARL